MEDLEGSGLGFLGIFCFYWLNMQDRYPVNLLHCFLKNTKVFSKGMHPNSKREIDFYPD